jgi:hypothetical protein
MLKYIIAEGVFLTNKYISEKLKFFSSSESHIRLLHSFNLFFIFLIFILNFIGSPALKIVFLGYYLFVFLTILNFEWVHSLFVLIPLLFIEGQGRVIFDYNPIARIFFDLVVIFGIMKGIISQRKLIDVKIIPRSTYIFILLHFAWYILQLFNPDNLGFFAVLTASKIYIFPILMFLFFIQNPIDPRSTTFITLTRYILLIYFLECFLSIYQMKMKEELLLSISDSYNNALDEGNFKGEDFRPFGTTFLPGAISVYFTFTLGLVYIRKARTTAIQILTVIAIFLSSFTMFIGQIRSSLLNFVLLNFGYLFVLFIESRKKGNSVFRLLGVFVVISLMLLVNYSRIEVALSEIDLTSSIGRWYELLDATENKGKYQDREIRITPSHFFTVIGKKLTDNPLGLGPARTGAASSLFLEQIKSDPQYGIMSSWTYDNTWIAIAIDFGIGGIFYFLLIMSIPIQLFSMALTCLRQKDYYRYRIIAICFISVIVFIIGSWAANSLPYNPGSFMFWFYAGIGFSSYYAGGEIKRK